MADTQLLTQLRQLLADRFNDGEIRTLCFDLGVDYDDLPGSGKADKARELVDYMDRYERLADLVRDGRQARPDIPWPAIKAASEQSPSTQSRMPRAEERSEPIPSRIEVASSILKLSGPQVQELMAALLDAYDENSLSQMVRFQLEERLDLIAGGGNLSQVVFNLIAWAERTGRIAEFIGKAQAANPGNARLAAFARSLPGIAVVEPARGGAPQAPPRGAPAAALMAFDWATVPGGEFLMGSNKRKDTLAFDDEAPQHTLHLPEYRIARVPVTVAQFAAFMAANQGYRTTAEQQDSAWNWTGSEYKEIKGADWVHPRGLKSDVRAKQDHPVTCVSWHDAVAFCTWAGVRLPTEAEWEKAARGTDGRIWPWGNREPNSGVCNFNMTVGDTTPVDRYPDGKSPYGLLDVAGNVWEWTSSLWGTDVSQPEFGYPYAATDGRENQRAPDTVLRALRGGSFGDNAQDVRCASRYKDYPHYRLVYGGFRVVFPGV